MDKERQGYISFLESILEQNAKDLDIAGANFDNDGTCGKIVGWRGNGDLPETLADPDINALASRITKPGKHDGGQQDTHGIKHNLEEAEDGYDLISDLDELLEEEDLEDSPLNVLEEEADASDDLDIPEGPINEDGEIEVLEEVKFTDQEGEIITRLIGEMNSLAENLDTDADDVLDTNFLDEEFDDLDDDVDVSTMGVVPDDDDIGDEIEDIVDDFEEDYY